MASVLLFVAAAFDWPPSTGSSTLKASCCRCRFLVVAQKDELSSAARQPGFVLFISPFASMREKSSKNFREWRFSSVERAFHPRHQVVPQYSARKLKVWAPILHHRLFFLFFFLYLFLQPPCLHRELVPHKSGRAAALMASAAARRLLIAKHMNIHSRRGKGDRVCGAAAPN